MKEWQILCHQDIHKDIVLKTRNSIKHELLWFWANLSRKWLSIKDYWERKLLDDIYDYIENIKKAIIEFEEYDSTFIDNKSITFLRDKFKH